MRFHIRPKRAAGATGHVLLMAVLIGSLLVLAESAAAQCSPNPTGETAVGLRNSSSYFLTFYIDDRNVGGVPSGDRSIDFVVSPGEHTLRADAVISGETVSASRRGNIPAGQVCTWVVTDPPQRAEAKTRMVNFPNQSKSCGIFLTVTSFRSSPPSDSRFSVENLKFYSIRISSADGTNIAPFRA